MENTAARYSWYLNNIFVQGNKGPHYFKVFLIATTKATST